MSVLLLAAAVLLAITQETEVMGLPVPLEQQEMAPVTKTPTTQMIRRIATENSLLLSSPKLSLSLLKG